MDTSIEVARGKGYVETIKGRKRYLNDINSANAVVRGVAERNAINAPIQGSAADVIKIAMINIWNEMNRQKLSSKMILQVHDELNFDVWKPELEQVKAIVKHEMEHAVNIGVPLTVEMNAGDNWLDAH
jgi:DNA polymerase-1